VARLYSAYFDRAPDYAGARYWNTLYGQGTLTLTQISDFFALSAEFRSRYNSLTNRQFVALLYRQALKRQPDAAGADYWTGQLDTRRLTRGELVVQFSESIEFVRLAAPQVTGPAWNGDVADSYRRGIEMNVLPGPND